MCSYCLQDSETVYRGRLSLVADLLQALFKDAYTLQKALLELLDKMSLNIGASEDEVSDIVSCMCLCVPFLTTAEHLVAKLSHCFIPSKDLSCFGICCFLPVFLLSHSQLAGYLLYHFQPGYGAACKHVEIRYQVSRQEALKKKKFFLTCEWMLFNGSFNHLV